MEIERKKDNEAEKLLAERLIIGEPDGKDPEAEAVRKLPPRWEIRIQTERDPVAEETELYRKIAKEADDRYDRRPGSKNGAD